MCKCTLPGGMINHMTCQHKLFQFTKTVQIKQMNFFCKIVKNRIWKTNYDSRLKQSKGMLKWFPTSFFLMDFLTKNQTVILSDDMCN